MTQKDLQIETELDGCDLAEGTKSKLETFPEKIITLSNENLKTARTAILKLQSDLRTRQPNCSTKEQNAVQAILGRLDGIEHTLALVSLYLRQLS